MTTAAASVASTAPAARLARRAPALRRGLVVVNPAAGAVTPQLLDLVVAHCGRWLDEVELHLTTGPGDAAIMVAAAVSAARAVSGPAGGPIGGGDLPDVIVAVGGDGTVREVAAGLARGLGRWPQAAPLSSPAPESRARPGTGHAGGARGRSGPAVHSPVLLVVPAGTGNSCYRALWADLPWADLLDAALAADPAGSVGAATDPADPGPPGELSALRVRDLDLARIAEDGTAVLLGASSGFIARVTEVALADFADVPGRDRYHHAIAEVFGGFQPYPGRVVVDGTPLHEGPTMMATIGGARHRVGTFELLPRSVLDDGLLDVCVVDGVLGDDERSELAGLTLTGQHLGHPAVRYARGRQIVIERTDGEPLCFEHDGEVWAQRRCRVTIDTVPHAVPVLAPSVPVAG